MSRPSRRCTTRSSAVVRTRHADTLFSDDGSTVDEQVAASCSRRKAQTIATAESCTGGLLAARLTEKAGASDYVKGGIVVYSNEAKIAQAGVPAELIERHGAVSAEVAEALAEGARAKLGADVGVGVTGIAGPGGGTEEKPVGLVWLSVATADDRALDPLGQSPGLASRHPRPHDDGRDAPDPPRAARLRSEPPCSPEAVENLSGGYEQTFRPKRSLAFSVHLRPEE